jgi:hypothetical protein
MIHFLFVERFLMLPQACSYTEVGQDRDEDGEALSFVIIAFKRSRTVQIYKSYSEDDIVRFIFVVLLPSHRYADDSDQGTRRWKDNRYDCVDRAMIFSRESSYGLNCTGHDIERRSGEFATVVEKTP